MKRDRSDQKTDHDHELALIEREHKSRLDRIEKWNEPRREAAVARAVHRMPSLRKQTAQPFRNWSKFCTGIVVAADQEIFIEG